MKNNRSVASYWVHCRRSNDERTTVVRLRWFGNSQRSVEPQEALSIMLLPHDIAKRSNVSSPGGFLFFFIYVVECYWILIKLMGACFFWRRRFTVLWIRSTFHLSFPTPLGIGEKYGRDWHGWARMELNLQKEVWCWCSADQKDFRNRYVIRSQVMIWCWPIA